MGDGNPLSLWYRGTVLAYVKGWFRTKLMVIIEECQNPEDGKGYQPIPRKNVIELSMNDVANWL